MTPTSLIPLVPKNPICRTLSAPGGSLVGVHVGTQVACLLGGSREVVTFPARTRNQRQSIPQRSAEVWSAFIITGSQLSSARVLFPYFQALPRKSGLFGSQEPSGSGKRPAVAAFSVANNRTSLADLSSLDSLLATHRSLADLSSLDSLLATHS